MQIRSRITASARTGKEDGPAPITGAEWNHVTKICQMMIDALRGEIHAELRLNGEHVDKLRISTTQIIGRISLTFDSIKSTLPLDVV